MPSVMIDLHISADEFVRLYQGTAKNVLARSVDGKRVRFPAQILRPYVTRSGVQGRFRINTDSQNRFLAIERLD